jgi:hypothetical protein
MRGALLVLTLVAAACGNDHGVTVVIHPNSTDVTKVRLYIGVGDQNMTDLTDDTFKVAGAWYWTRDPGNELDLQNVVSHGDVTFNYDTSETIPVVIAVGYDDQGQPIVAGVADSLDPALGRNDFQIYEITLAAADPFSPTSSAMQLGLWSPMTTDLVHASCAGIIDATKPHPYFVVLDNDQDCDGFLDGTDAECTPDIYHGTRGADPTEANCLYATPASNGLGAVCQLGGSPCKDNTPVTMVSCQPGTTCLPTSLCAAGVCPATHPDDYQCAADIVGSMVNPTMHAHYDCTVPTKANGAVCDSLKLPLDRPPTGGYDCTAFDIGDSMTVLGGSIKQDNVTFNADHLDTTKSCAATVSINGMPMDLTKPLSGLVDFTLKNTGGVAIPIVFTFDKTLGCTSQPRCVLDVQTFDDPAQTRCAAGWMPSAMVEVSTSLTEAQDPTLTDDQKAMFYISAGNIFTSAKSATGWGPATVIPLLTTDNRSPDIGGTGATNGTSMVYTGVAAGVRSIYIASRTAVDTAFTDGIPLVDTTGALSSFTAATFAPPNPMDAAGTQHLLAAGNLAGGTQELYDVAYNAQSSMIVSITKITIANGPMAPDKPHLTPDGLQLYFEGIVQTRVALFVASRTSIDDQFTYAVELSELSGSSPYTGGAWVAPGGRTMYFTQQNTAGLDRIYSTTRANL